MALIEWKSNFSVGLPAIDAQHRHLVGLINELYDAMREGRANAKLGEVLDRLISYTQTHFRSEERLMTSCNFPGYEQHLQEHREFEKTVKSLAEGFRGGKVALSTQVFMFLKDWLQTHILDSDQRYAKHMGQSRTGPAVTAAR